MVEDTRVEVGEIVNTHGLRGEVKIKPFTNTPEFFTRFKRLFIGGTENALRVMSSRVHKGGVIVKLDGVDFDAANALRGKPVFADKADAGLDDGEFFVDDVIGLRAVDDETGGELGVIADFFLLPSNGVYVVRGAREIMIPAVPEFVREINAGGGFVRFRLIEGM